MDGSSEEKIKALRFEVETWATEVFDQSLQYQNACWWIVPLEDRASLLRSLLRISAEAGSVMSLLAKFEADNDCRS